MNPKVKIIEGEGIGAHSLACSISGVEGHVGASGWGLGRLTSRSLTHTNLHKLNNKLVVHSWNTFGERISHGQTWTHKTHHDSDLGEATTFPLIVFFMFGHGLAPKCHFVLGLPSASPQIPKIGILVTLEAYNFVCKPLIEVRFDENL